MAVFRAVNNFSGHIDRMHETTRSPLGHCRHIGAQLRTRRHSLRFPLGTSQGDHNWPATNSPTLPPVSPGYMPRGTTTGQLPNPPTLPPVSPGYIPGGPRLASYRPADTPSGFPWVHPRRTTTGQLPTRRHSLWFPLGTSQGDHDWPATDGHPAGHRDTTQHRPADTPSGFPWVHPRGTTTGQLPTRRHSPPVSPGYIPGGPRLASYRPADTPSGFPWVHPGDHDWPATNPPTLPLVSPGYIPGGPQLASYQPADTPSGFPWVHPRGTTTGQLPTGPTPMSGRASSNHHAGVVPRPPRNRVWRSCRLIAREVSLSRFPSANAAA